MRKPGQCAAQGAGCSLPLSPPMGSAQQTVLAPGATLSSAHLSRLRVVVIILHNGITFNPEPESIKSSSLMPLKYIEQVYYWKWTHTDNLSKWDFSQIIPLIIPVSLLKRKGPTTSHSYFFLATCSCWAFSAFPHVPQSFLPHRGPSASAQRSCTSGPGSRNLPSPQSAGTPPPWSAPRRGHWGWPYKREGDRIGQVRQMLNSVSLWLREQLQQRTFHLPRNGCIKIQRITGAVTEWGRFNKLITSVILLTEPFHKTSKTKTASSLMKMRTLSWLGCIQVCLY